MPRWSYVTNHQCQLEKFTVGRFSCQSRVLIFVITFAKDKMADNGVTLVLLQYTIEELLNQDCWPGFTIHSDLQVGSWALCYAKVATRTYRIRYFYRREYHLRASAEKTRIPSTASGFPNLKSPRTFILSFFKLVSDPIRNFSSLVEV